MNCPRCRSKNVVIIEDNLGFIKCNDCGFNELDEFSAWAEPRKSQREKPKYNVYKTGGSRR